MKLRNKIIRNIVVKTLIVAISINSINYMLNLNHKNNENPLNIGVFDL